MRLVPITEESVPFELLDHTLVLRPIAASKMTSCDIRCSTVIRTGVDLASSSYEG
jgi:hypothetical protein